MGLAPVNNVPNKLTSKHSTSAMKRPTTVPHFVSQYVSQAMYHRSRFTITILFILGVAVHTDALPSKALGCRIVVTDNLPGDGRGTPWKLTQTDLFAAVTKLTPTCKTVFFPAGAYSCGNTPIVIDFEKLNATTAKHLRSGVRFIGENFASKLQFGMIRNDSALHFTWSRGKGQPGNAVFNWEFSGITIVGGSDTALVAFGNPNDGNDIPWNSCIFDLNVNNGYRDGDTPTSDRGTAVGTMIVRGLQSRINLVSTCARGTGAVLKACEFSTIAGSFSNTDSPDPTVPSGHRVTHDGVALLLDGSSSNTFLALNCEVAYNCIYVHGSSYGNVFNSMDVTNCDMNGAVIIPECKTIKGKGITSGGTLNTFNFINIRGSRQGVPGSSPKLYLNGTAQSSNTECLAVSHVIRP